MAPRKLNISLQKLWVRATFLTGPGPIFFCSVNGLMFLKEKIVSIAIPYSPNALRIRHAIIAAGVELIFIPKFHVVSIFGGTIRSARVTS